MMKTALIVIDIQNDYFAGGRMALEGMEDAARNCQVLLGKFRAVKAPTFIIQHLFDTADAPFFAPKTHGAELHPSVTPASQDCVLVKNKINSFLGTELLQRLQLAKVEKIVFCGAMSHMCIDAAVRAAADFGFNCIVAHDACATRALEFNGVIVSAKQVHAAYMAALKTAYAHVVASEEVLCSLAGE